MSRKPTWLERQKNYHQIGDTLGISNEQIRDSRNFDGWEPEYLKWHEEHWKNKERGIPSHDVPKNAYHIRHLAEAMKSDRKWIGRPLQILPNGCVIEGNHRARAAEYLRDCFGILISEPNEIEIFLGTRRGHHSTELINGTFATLDDAMLLVHRLEQCFGDGYVAWLAERNPLFGGEKPIETAKRLDFGGLMQALAHLEPHTGQ